jgi:hypothetical protein
MKFAAKIQNVMKMKYMRFSYTLALDGLKHATCIIDATSFSSMVL